MTVKMNYIGQPFMFFGEYMPELPEVETIVRELRSSAKCKVLLNVTGKMKPVFHPSINDSERIVRGLSVVDVVRRGKFIVFVLDKGMRLVVHLRMTGRLMWKVEKGRRKFVRMVFIFTDGTKLYFSDVRKFGRVWILPEKVYEAITGIGKLGLEPLKANLESFMKLMKGRKGILKNTLLRQDLLAGIGNIYADEICFRVGVHPSSRLEKLGRKKEELLFEAVRSCLREGIRHCGVSVSDFVGTRGDLGRHQHYLNVYGRDGLDCRRCGDTIKRTVVAGRGTFFCPSCQPLHGCG
jgi:formamidopyrimidine-DNA glycosylase